MLHNEKNFSSEINDFKKDGFIIKRKLFSEKEVKNIMKSLESDPLIKQHMFDRDDSDGNSTLSVQWNNPGKSSYGVGARMKKIVNVVEELLGGEVYHWHSKVTAKAAKEGGAWEWHQDYGYWYNHGCLYPDMMSVMVALDKSTKENGCLQVLKGSHQIGRIDHIKMVKENGDLGQVCADQERIKWAETKHENIFCEMEPGDALFFHGNTLHGSGANKSEMRRWALLFCYNTASNNPFIETHQPFYNQINKAEDNYIIENGVTLGDGSENFQSTYTKKK